MYHSLLRDAKFLAFLATIDEDLANEARTARCAKCGGVLDSAAFPRKARAVADVGDAYARRFSFCCREEGCRRRRTPASVRFLGRKVYVAAVVLLATAMQHGVNARRIRELADLLGINRRTLGRWRTWWREIFAASKRWRAAAGQIGAVETAAMPLSLIECFVGDERERVTAALRFVAPLTASKARN